MRIRPSRSPAPLRCELHAHTTWSDGRLTPDELVDLYGQDGFDVLCITDHVLRTDDPAGPMVDAAAHRGYLEAVERAAARAARLYRMLVLPGLELTYWHDDPDQAVHAVAVGLRRFVAVDDGPREAMREARAAGAAIIAAHPHGAWSDPVPGRTTRGVFCDPDRMRDLVDRYELVNRHDVFGWVARERLPAVASGDAHGPEHLHTWKTLLPCERSEAAVIAYLRSDGPAYLTHPAPGDRSLAA